MTIGSAVSRVYLSGPMSGYENFNFPAFEEAAYILRELGHDVFSPHEQGWGNGDPDTGTVSEEEYQEFLREDFKQVSQADVVYVLPGWEGSRGAMREIQVARWCSIPVIDFTSGQEVPAWMGVEQDDLLQRFIKELQKPTGDGAKKRSKGDKIPWHLDDSHEAAIFSHLKKWKQGEHVDPDSKAHPLVHAAWRCLAIACKETGNIPKFHSVIDEYILPEDYPKQGKKNAT